MHRIEGRALSLFKEVLRKWDDDTLWEKLAQRQFAVDMQLNKIC